MLNNFTNTQSDERLEPFVIQVPVVSSSVLGKEVKTIFNDNPELEGIVVLDNATPQGIIMRTTFFQKLGSLYGNSLFMERSIKMLMDKEMMIVNVDDTVASVGVTAMNRPQSRLYDYVIVQKNKAYLGAISIRQFLIGLSKRNEAQIEVLKQQQDKLLTAHKQEVDLRNNLISKSQTVKNLLDHAGQGFLLFGNDLIIKNEYSSECIKIFKKPIEGNNYISLISQYFEKDVSAVFSAAFTGYFSNNTHVTDNVYLMLLPQEVLIEDKSIHFEYKRIENSQEKSVMVILSDITENKAMQKAMQDEQNTKHLVIKALTYQAQISQMLLEFKELFEDGYKSFFSGNTSFEASLNELYRAVHTFKGDFAQYGFINSSEGLHIFEDKLHVIVSNSNNYQTGDVDKLMSQLNVNDILSHDLNIIADVLGEGFFEANNNISIPQQMFAQIEQLVQNGQETYNKDEVCQILQGLKRRNIKTYLNQYQDYLQYLSERLMKKMPIYVVEGDDIYIDPDRYNDLLRSMVHIYRNIMDHGIETEEERLSDGKPEQGIVLCKIEKAETNSIKLTISDDGRGIDTEKLANKALVGNIYDAKQLKNMSEQQLINLIFLDNFSTKEKADSLSGRGIGMAAVKYACEKLDGSLEVSSQQGIGTTFTFILPHTINIA